VGRGGGGKEGGGGGYAPPIILGNFAKRIKGGDDVENPLEQKRGEGERKEPAPSVQLGGLRRKKRVVGYFTGGKSG